MIQFGSQPPRSLDSFGVIGVLGDRCKIYYDTIFTTRHIGRVSDLLAARLKDVAPDELRFRIVLMFSLYEAYRCQLEALAKGDGISLPEPLVVECGVDDEKLAIGISFTYPEKQPVDPALAQKLSSTGPTTRFERFVAQMIADSDQVVVRIQSEIRRVEVVSLLGIPGKIAASQLGTPRAPEVVVLKADAKVSSLKGEYVELGDTDYRKLLQEDGAGRLVQKPATGEILVQGAAEAEEKLRIAGEEATKEMITRISGTTQHYTQDQQRIKVSAAAVAKDEIEDMELNAESASTDPEAELLTAKKQLDLYQTRIDQLQVKIQSLETKHQTQTVVVKGSDQHAVAEENEAPKPARSLKTMLKSLFGRRREELRASEPDKLDAPSDAGPSTPDPIADKILREQVERLEVTIARMRKEARSLKDESSGTRAQKWADGMVGELLAEKARIHEIAKKLNVTSRQKEIEHRNRETRLNEEIRRKDEQLRQKSYALDRAKEQASQLTVSLERSRSHAQLNSDDGQVKQKLSFTQKLLQTSKDENFALTKKVEELKGQLAAAQSSGANKPRTAGDMELGAMRTRYERLQKQNEEFKRANQLLMEKVNEIQKPKSGSMSGEELKKKLETAMRLAANYQKESDQLRLKVEELQREEARLKGELNRIANTTKSPRRSGGGEAA